MCACKSSKNLSNPKEDLPPPFAVKESPRAIEKLFIEASTQMIRGDYRQATDLFEEVLSKDSKNHAAMYFLAKLAMEQREYDRSVEFVQRAIVEEDKNYWYYKLLKESLEYKGDFETAIGVNERIVENFPDRISDQYDLVDLYTRYKYTKKALTQLNTWNKTLVLMKQLEGKNIKFSTAKRIGKTH